LVLWYSRVGHGSGPSMGWVGSGRVGSGWVTQFSVLVGLVALGPVSIYVINIKFTRKNRLFDDYNL